MRISTLWTLLVVVPACWADNPLFGVVSETAATSATTEASATTGSVGSSTDVTAASGSGATGTVPTSSGEAGSEGPGTGEPVSSSEPTGSGGESSTTTSSMSASTSTGEPGSSGGETTLSGGTTGDPVVCADPPVNASLNVEVKENGMAFTGCTVGVTEVYKGLLYMDGTVMKLKSTADCAPADPPTSMVLMSGFNIPAMPNPVCASVAIDWDPEGVNCKLGLLQARNAETQKLLYVGAFRLKPPDGFPLHTDAVNVISCGCPPGMPDCCDPMPGEIELIPTDGDPVAQYEEGYAKENGVIYDFHNFQSWIDPECTMGGSSGRHIDWLAVVVSGG